MENTIIISTVSIRVGYLYVIAMRPGHISDIEYPRLVINITLFNYSHTFRLIFYQSYYISMTFHYYEYNYNIQVGGVSFACIQELLSID